MKDLYFDSTGLLVSSHGNLKKFDMPRTTLSSILNRRTRCDVTDLVDSYFGFVN